MIPVQARGKSDPEKDYRGGTLQEHADHRPMGSDHLCRDHPALHLITTDFETHEVVSEEVSAMGNNGMGAWHDARQPPDNKRIFIFHNKKWHMIIPVLILAMGFLTGFEARGGENEKNPFLQVQNLQSCILRLSDSKHGIASPGFSELPKRKHSSLNPTGKLAADGYFLYLPISWLQQPSAGSIL